MSDNRLRRALRSVGDRYVSEHPADFESFREGVAKRQRRRRWIVGLSSVAATATAVVAVLFVVNAPRPDAPTDPAGENELRIVSEVRLGDVAYEVAGIGNSAFMAVRDQRSVVRLDRGATLPTWETVLPSEPADILEGASYAWASLPETDQLARVDPQTGDFDLYDLAPYTGPTRMHVGERALRVVVDQGVVRMSYGTREPVLIYEGDVTDVAMGRTAFWLLLGDGTVDSIDPDTGEDSGLPDMQLGVGGEITYLQEKLWFGVPDASVLHRVDEATGVLEGTTDLPGDYADIDAGPDGLWVLTRGEGGSVVQLDPGTGTLGPRSLSFDGEPLDLAYGETGIWVSFDDGRVVLVEQLP